jgi:hypothetical protein
MTKIKQGCRRRRGRAPYVRDHACGGRIGCDEDEPRTLRRRRPLVGGAPVWKLVVMIGVTSTTGNDFVVRNLAVETVT